MRTRLTEDAGVEHPIICGAMYPCSNPELVAAASEGMGARTMVVDYGGPVNVTLYVDAFAATAVVGEFAT